MSLVPRRAHHGDQPCVTGTVTDAFLALEVSRWLVPELPWRRKPLRAHLGLAVEHAMTGGHVDLLDGGAGMPGAAASWLHCDRGTPPPAPQDYRPRLERACGVHLRRFLVLDELFDACHPPDLPPHDYLTVLGVRPGQQRLGLGTALLRHHHERLDRHGRGAFLVAVSAHARALYQAQGYTVIREARLPDSGPTLWAMWRAPSRKSR